MDISYCEDGEDSRDEPPPISGPQPSSLVRQTIIAAIRTAVNHVDEEVRPTIGVSNEGPRFLRTTDFSTSPFGVCGSGRYLNLPLTFPKHGVIPEKTLVLQLCERDKSWTPWNLVGTYWARGFMQVSVTEIGGKLLGRRPVKDAPALVNPFKLLSDLQGLKLPSLAADVIADFFSLLKRLTETPEAHPDLCSKPPQWDPEWTSKHPAAGYVVAPTDGGGLDAWVVEKEKQEAALIDAMPCFLSLKGVPRFKRLEQPLGTVVKVIRKVLWRYPRDALKGGIKYDWGASQAAVRALLWDSAMADKLVWGARGSRELAIKLDDLWQSSLQHAPRLPLFARLASFFARCDTANRFRSPELLPTPGVLSFCDGLAA